jgi:cell division protein FtsW
MAFLSRADQSTLGRWWWTVDRATLAALFVLIGFGYVLVLAASPAVAIAINVPRDQFILKQIVFLCLSGVVMIGLSLMTTKQVLQFALIAGTGALLLTAATLVGGEATKGARRWISLGGFSLQPSEFLKPCFAVIAGFLIARGSQDKHFPGKFLACAIFALIALLLGSQPDIGMMVVVTAVFLLQLFLGGLNLYVMGALGGAGVASLVATYFFSDHARKRIDGFMNADLDKQVQIKKALEAFANGGLLGRGPGEGHIKDTLPDAHTDFVFAVAGEEFGLLVCLLILGIFAFIVLRGLARLTREEDPAIALAGAGLVASFGIQAFINMASSLRMIPTKGMTLPFISYGGSSALAVAVGMGLLLALTRRRVRTDAR